jgi:spore coat protein CotH
MDSFRRRAFRSVFAATTAMAITVAGIVGLPTIAEAKVNTSMVEGRDKAAKFFNPLSPIRIDMTIPTDTWNFIQNNIYSTSYKQAFLTITMGGKAIQNPLNDVNSTEWEVGIRLKGRASRRDLTAKAPFKIKMDKFVDDQTLFGLQKLTLNNMVQDPSLVRESTVYRLFRNMGVPAPRTGYAAMYVTSPGQVTNEYFGLYLNIETPDEVMLERWFGNNTAHLYESAYDTDVTTDYYHQYLDSIDVGSEDDVSDLTSFVTISDLTGSDWWDVVRDRADMNEILALMGTDIFVSNWDGYTDFVRNNHFAHFDLNGTLSIMPWGNDQVYPDNEAFQFAFDGSNPDPRGWSDVRSIMYRRCVTVPECNYQLMGAIDDAATTTESLNLAQGVSLIVSAIDALVTADTRKEATNAFVDEQQEFVLQYQRNRVSEWSNWKTRLTPNAPEASVSCSRRACDFEITSDNSSNRWTQANVVQQFVGRKWKTIRTTALVAFTLKVAGQPPNFRVRAMNRFGTSGWVSVIPSG